MAGRASSGRGRRHRRRARVLLRADVAPAHESQTRPSCLTRRRTGAGPPEGDMRHRLPPAFLRHRERRAPSAEVALRKLPSAGWAPYRRVGIEPRDEARRRKRDGRRAPEEPARTRHARTGIAQRRERARLLVGDAAAAPWGLTRRRRRAAWKKLTPDARRLNDARYARELRAPRRAERVVVASGVRSRRPPVVRRVANLVDRHPPASHVTSARQRAVEPPPRAPRASRSVSPPRGEHRRAVGVWRLRGHSARPPASSGA